MLRSAYWSTGLRISIAMVCAVVLFLFGYVNLWYLNRKRKQRNMALRATEGIPTEASPTQIIIGWNRQLGLPIAPLPSYDDIQKDSLPSYDEIGHLPPVYPVQ